MNPVTSTYKRKDGTRARSYMCKHVKAGTGLCDATSVRAEPVDAVFIDANGMPVPVWRLSVPEPVADDLNAKRDTVAGLIATRVADLQLSAIDPEHNGEGFQELWHYRDAFCPDCAPRRISVAWTVRRVLMVRALRMSRKPQPRHQARTCTTVLGRVSGADR
jgi:hypothetical protein